MGGSSLAPEVIRRSFGEQGGWPSLHVLDSTDAGAMRSVEDGHRPRPRALPGLDEVRRHDRDAVAVQALLVAALGRQRVRRHHRPGLGPGEARQRARLPAHLPQRPRHRRALQRAVVLRPGPGGAHGRRCRRAAARRRRGRAQLPELRVRRRVERAVAGARVGRAGGRRPRQADLRHRPAAAVLRAVGRAAHRRVDRQAGQGDPARGRRAGRASPTSTARTAPSCTCATASTPTRRPTPRSRRCARPATR